MRLRLSQSLGPFIVHILMPYPSSLLNDNHYYLSCDVPMQNTFQRVIILCYNLKNTAVSQPKSKILKIAKLSYYFD